jgi:hypothetical protein
MNVFSLGPDPADRRVVAEAVNVCRAALNRRLALKAALVVLPGLSAAALAAWLLWRSGAARGWLPGAAWFLAAPPLGLPPALLVWLALAGAGSVIAALAARRRRLDSPDAARWLDERLGGRDLVSAAHGCLDGTADPEFAGRLAAQAAALLRRSAPRRPGFYPWRRLAGRGALASAALAASLSLALAWNPDAATLAEVAAGGRNVSNLAAAAPGTGQSAPAAPAPAAGEQAARLADKLFPEDKRLAALAREALNSRDAAALDYLLSQNNLTRDDLDRLADSSRDVPKAGEDQPQSGQPKKPEQKDQGERQGKSESGGQGQSAQPRQESGQDGNQAGGDQRQQPPSAGRDQGQGQGQGGAGQGRPQPGQGNREAESGGAGGKAGGYGQSNSRTERRPDAGRLGEDLMIRQPDPAKPFEIVLPGKDASRPLRAVVPEARRAAEAAVARRSAPLSYEEYVTSYFTILSQEAKQ